MKFILRLVASATALLVSITAVAATQRPLQVSDLFEMEQLTRLYDGPFAFSPDGESLAFVKARAPSTWSNHRLGFFFGNAHADVWINSRGKSVNLTHGLAEQAGWCAPSWSPDGQRLALVRIDESGVPKIFLWEQSTGKIRALPGLARPHLNLVYKRPYAWLDSSRLICAEIGDGVPLVGSVEQRMQGVAAGYWATSAQGKTVTVSALDSGIPRDLSLTKPSRIVLVDVVSGEQRTLASGLTTEWLVSPAGAHVAHCRQTGTVTVRDGVPLPLRTADISILEIVAVDGSRPAFTGPQPEDVILNSLRWSADSRRLAFVAFATSGDERPALFVADLDTQKLECWPTADLDLAPIPRGQVELEWTSADQLMVRGVKQPGTSRVSPETRREWWAVNRAGETLNLTAKLPAAPSQLWRHADGRRFQGQAGPSLCIVDPAAGEASVISVPGLGRIKSIVWPAAGPGAINRYATPYQTYDQLVVAVAESDDLVAVDLRTNAGQPLAKPSAKAELKLANDGQFLFTEDSRRGTFLWRQRSGQPAEQVMAANLFLAGIAESPTRFIKYTSLAGEKLTAAVFLPPDYQPGRRYPTIVRVYGGNVVTDKIRGNDALTNPSFGNVHILPARGFVLLVPSMPLKPEGMIDDAYQRQAEGVLPAMDALVEQGIADPDRFLLLGHSYGGYGVYGLVTQTHRFKAAAALAGISDLVSYYGTFDPRTRYTDTAHESYFQQALAETGQFLLGNPPWRDPARYARNSPINFVDRVQTPLLIEYGDVDYVPMQQGEQYFSSLVRQGKRARFLRYWGEGHVVTSPANVTDLYREIIAWFDQFAGITRGPDGLPIYQDNRVVAPKPTSP